LLDKTGKNNSYKISGGFIEVLDNKVSVLVEGATAL
jgi:F0F1-type ATP synthase epsilon subunit